jgi:dienelactone hydrolase
MRLTFALVIMAFVSGLGLVQSAQSGPQVVEVPSGGLRLKALLWKPTGRRSFPVILFNHGSGTDPQHSAGLTLTEAAGRLAPVFVKHGYAFLYLCRRGQGLSEDQAPFMRTLLDREEAANGVEARRHLQFSLLTTEQLDDTMAALALVKTLPGIDAHRIALVGHSFGGQLTLLAAEKDTTVRAAVTFGAAAESWQRSAELRDRLTGAVSKITAPVMLIHAENDYSTLAGHALSEVLEKLKKPHALKIYPPVGTSADDGHNMVYSSVQVWEKDVFRFLDENDQ